MSIHYTELVFPPTDGSILLPDTLAFHRTHNATASMYLYAEEGTGVISEVSYSQFDRACQRVARSIGTDFDFSTRPVVALIALADTLLYQAMVLGIMSMGLIPFPISPRNSAAAIAHLLKSTSCHHVLATCCTLSDLVTNIQEAIHLADPLYPLEIREIPALLEIFPEFSDGPTHCEREPPADLFISSDGHRKLGLDDIAVYLHSSGSTGFPKPIPRTHRNILEYILSPCCTAFLNRPKRVRMPGMQLPPFHAIGIVVELFLPLFSCVSIVLFPPGVKSAAMMPVLATPENTLEHMRRTACNALVSIPAFLQVWARDKEAIDFLRGLDVVTYGGGSLSQTLGDSLVANGIKLQSVYGGTEAGAPAYSSLRPNDEKEWDYFEFSDNCDVRWIPQGDGTYECQLYTTATYHLSIHNLPNAGFATSDLFRRHPTKDYLWKFAGRLDDIIPHSSGEKTVPLPLEGIIMSSPHISGCVIFGKGHDQPGVLIEPSPEHEIDVTDTSQVSQFRNLIWPIIDEANKAAPAYSKLFKELILIADKCRPLPRAPKGTVIRKQALNAYADEIEALYGSIESSQVSELMELDEGWGRDDQCVMQWIVDQLHELCPGKVISASENLFEQGLDSLSATILQHRITSALNSLDPKVNSAKLCSRATIAAHSIAQNVIYTHPTVNALARYIIELVNNPSKCQPSMTSMGVQDHVEAIEDMIRRYQFPALSECHSFQSPRASDSLGIVALITGSTGHLGSQVLEGLCRDPNIRKIYTLNRPSSSQSIIERHKRRFRDKDMDDEILELSKIVYLETEYSDSQLGLPDELYSELSCCVNIIIHIAWRLDFNLSLSSFESHIRGTHNLIKLARSRQGGSDVKFIFTSSVSAAQSWDQSVGPYPEELIMDPKCAVGIGYGESKYVTERILSSSGLNATSLRIGQITGSSNGAWATSDWIPILVKSCLEMDCLPSAYGNVSWLPMDVVTNCILDLVSFDGSYPKAMNLVHPRSVKWDSVMGYLREALRQKRAKSLPFIPFDQWIELLEGVCTAPNADDLRRIPAIKLQEFFKGLSARNLVNTDDVKEVFGATDFSTMKMEKASRTFATVNLLMQEDASRWVKYWDSRGFFD